jgi:N-acetylmuramoyl-L-alanine amidase
LLTVYGYDVPSDDDLALAKVIVAFQRHFRPRRVDGVLDGETMARLTALAGLIA